ncbi:hypothetical protein D1872_227680 [compost metagenome]
MCVVIRTVSVVRVIKHSTGPSWVPAHEQLIEFTRERTQDRLHDTIFNPGSFVHNEKHVVFMETLHVLRLGSRPGCSKPTFLVISHVNLSLRPLEYQFEQGAFLLPLADFCPKYIVQLLTSRCCTDNLRKRETR